MTTDAVLTGAWRLPAEQRLLVVFANVSDQRVKAPFRLDPQSHGLNASLVRRTISRDGLPADQPTRIASPVREEIEFAPRSVQAWEVAPAR